jgi:hypothetical protein
MFNRPRVARHSLITALSTVALIALVVVIYGAVEQRSLTLDMTESAQFTLSKETLAILERIERPMQITGFYSAQAVRFRELDDQIARLYTVATDGLVRVEYVDPDVSVALGQQFQLQVDGEMFISYLTDDGDIDFNTVQRVVVEYSQERNITSAILRLLDLNKFTVGFEVSASDIDPFDTSSSGLSGAINGLETNGIRTAAVSLEGLAVAGEEVPPEVSALVLTRMRRPLSAAGIRVLEQYMDRGGALLILADADFGERPFLSEADPLNDVLWQRFGLRMMDSVAVDALSNSGTELDLLSYATSDGSTITGRLNNQDDPESRVLLRVARSIQIDPNPPVTNGMVIATSPQSYGERDFSALATSNRTSYTLTEDDAGPLNVAAWADNTETGARLLLVGDGDFITNGLIGTPLGNSILFTDGIAWLTGFGQRVVFAPQARFTNLPTVFLSTGQLDGIAMLTLVVMPLGVLLAGLGIWWRRSRR